MIDLASAIASSPASAPGSALGTAAVAAGGGVTVVVDGSAGAVPCRSTTMVNDGDRVRVAAVDGTLTIVGNLTSRATDSRTFAATLADIPSNMNCIKQTDQGLLVGSTDASGKFVGSRTLLGESLYFIGPDGTVLGEFSKDGISIGGCEIEARADGEFAGLNIYSSEGIIRIARSRPATGEAGSSMRASPPMIEVSNGEVEISAGYLITDPEGGVSGSDAHSIHIGPDGISLYGDVYVNGSKIG